MNTDLFHINNFTKFMEQSRSETNSCSASQEISCLLWNPATGPYPEPSEVIPKNSSKSEAQCYISHSNSVFFVFL
jgi:hypothetical protein